MWYYTVNNQQAGPVDEAEIKKLVAAGTITAATQVWTNGMAAWAPIGSTPLASLVGSLPPAPPAFAPVAVDKPEVASIKKLFTWFWISLIAILIGIGLPVAMVLFFIIIYKAWKLVQHEGVRGDADKMVANCFIPGWNFYWYFPAFRGLAKEFNALFDREGMAHERFNLDLPTWMIICIYGSSITFGISLVAFLVLWIMYTVKVKNAAIAVLNARG
jgi:hypothetical protein